MVGPQAGHSAVDKRAATCASVESELVDSDVLVREYDVVSREQVKIVEKDVLMAMGDPERFRDFLDWHIEATPELFPAEIRRGYRMKDVYRSRKTGCELRRIELRNLQCYLVRPSFLTPYLSGRTEEVQAPLFFASSPSRSGR